MKTSVLKNLLVLSALLLLGVNAAPLGEGAKLRIKVYPSVSSEPAEIVVRVHVPSDGENRALELIADSGDYYRSSTIEMNGQQAAPTTFFRLRDLPSGRYDVTARLYGESDRLRAEVRQRIAVLGRNTDAP